ncbi:MAG TPA: LysE family transporter [Candidatus Limnocylindria bacterium]
MSSFLTGLVAGFAIAMPPGAVTSLIVRIGLQRGFPAALAAGWGTATVDGMYCVIAVLAGAAVVPLLGAIDPPLRVVTGLVLVGLGLRGILGARREAPSAGSTDARALVATYLRFVAITMVNPATLAYFVAVALGFAGLVLNDSLAFIVGVFIASLTWHAILAILSGSLHGRLSASARTVLTVAANGVVIALGVRILAQVFAG